MSKKFKIKRTDINLMTLNKEIAYVGKIGRLRRKFCIQYIEKKKRRSADIRQVQIKDSQDRGETISCQKGCWYCCLEFVEATIQECEAIVYYLYQNRSALSIFLQNYPKWREEVSKGGDIYKECEDTWNEAFANEFTMHRYQSISKLNQAYYRLKIPCPFLHERLCLIYAVRPYTCMSYYVTTPPDLCHPDNESELKIKQAMPMEIILDCSFYFRQLQQPSFLFMPLQVYKILEGGFAYLSTIHGLEGLEDEVMRDSDVKTVCRKYLKTH